MLCAFVYNGRKGRSTVPQFTAQTGSRLTYVSEQETERELRVFRANYFCEHVLAAVLMRAHVADLCTDMRTCTQHFCIAMHVAHFPPMLRCFGSKRSTVEVTQRQTSCSAYAMFKIESETRTVWWRAARS